MMSPQFVLRIAGYVALGLAVVLAAVSAQYFFSRDIRAVMDDLSGRARARGGATGITGRRSSSRSASRKARSRSAAPSVGATGGGPGGDTPVQGVAWLGTEDELDTVLDTKLRAAGEHGGSLADNAADINSDVKSINDDMPTAVEDVSAYPHKDGRDVPTTQARPLVQGDVDAAKQTAFRLTRSVVLIHSREVITTS